MCPSLLVCLCVSITKEIIASWRSKSTTLRYRAYMRIKLKMNIHKKTMHSSSLLSRSLCTRSVSFCVLFYSCIFKIFKVKSVRVWFFAQFTLARTCFFLKQAPIREQGPNSIEINSAIAFFNFSMAGKEILKFNHRKWCATRHINSWLGTENFDKIGRGEQIYQKIWRFFERKHPPRITEFYEWFLKYRYLNYNTPNHR